MTFDIELRQGTLDDIDFATERFDNVTLSHVLEHLHSPRALLERCAQLLGPGGRFFSLLSLMAAHQYINAYPATWCG
jgi:2-polyprenyl-3-methyl-5-hydroxy-6-metoxy-1,4-benzoquinol methylase